MKAILLSLLFLLNLVCHFANAADQSSRPELIEVKSRLEDSIAKRYRERIATRIPTELFNVAVQATIKIKEDNVDLKSTTTKETSNPKPDLPDINLGIIESIAAQDSGLTESSELTKIPKSFLERVEIKKIEIIVGLSPKLGEEYKANFKPWLSTTVKGDFGPIGTIKVADLAPMPKDETTETVPPERPRVLTFEEKFGNYQNVIGFGIFSLILIVGLLLYKFLPSRDIKEQINMSLRIQEMKDSQLRLQSASTKGLVDGKKTEKQEIQLNANLLFDSFREHQKKVALIALSSPGIADQVLDRWFEEGTEGRKKVASLVDCVLTHYGNNSSTIPLSGANWNLPERIKNDKELPSIFTAFSGYSLQEKTNLVEKTYWDLLSLKTLGDKLTSLPFSSMAQLPASKIQKVLSKQDKKVQSLTILHLPQEKMEEVVSGLSFEEKKNMLVEAFAIPKMKPQEIEMADQSLKFLIKKEDSVDDGLVEVQTMIPNMLMCLSPLEEIQLIQQILPTLSDQGQFIKRNYPSLAFISQWPEEKLKHFLTGVQPNDILALVKAIPEATEVINSVIPNRTQTILKDSLSKTLNSEELNNGLGTLRLKLFKYANDGIINLELIFKDAAAATAKAA